MLKMLEKNRASAFSPEAIEAYTTIGGTPHLDGGYTVFGEVIEGLDVIDRIAEMATDSNDRPLEDVVYHISLVK
jgi:peptidylprolyl isomerase